MEGFLEGLGITALVILAIIGVLAGAIAGRVAGKNTAGYILLGVLGALALPFILAALGVTVVAAGGILVLALVALAGAVIVLIIGRAIMK